MHQYPLPLHTPPIRRRKSPKLQTTIRPADATALTKARRGRNGRNGRKKEAGGNRIEARQGFSGNRERTESGSVRRVYVPDSKSTVQRYDGTMTALCLPIKDPGLPILAAVRVPFVLTPLARSFYQSPYLEQPFPTPCQIEDGLILSWTCICTETPPGQYKRYLAQANAISIRLNVHHSQGFQKEEHTLGQWEAQGHDRVTFSHHPNTARKVILILQSHATKTVPFPPTLPCPFLPAGTVHFVLLWRGGDAA